jgi:large subunit ribosomal protein L22
MEMQSYIKYQRISSKKIKYLGREITGKNAELVMEKLLLMGSKPAKMMYKAVKSALSNMKNKGITDMTTVKILSVSAGKGPLIKRWNPVSRGMAHQIKKETCHIRVVLSDGTKDVKSPEKKKEIILKDKKEEMIKKPKVVKERRQRGS